MPEGFDPNDAVIVKTATEQRVPLVVAVVPGNGVARFFASACAG